MSTVSTERVARSSPVTMPEHCAAVERTTGLLPIPPCFDVSELSTSTPLSDHEVLPRGLVQNKSRIAYHHRLEQDRSVSDSHRSRHRRCGRFVRDAPAREAGIVQRRGKLPMDVELSVSSFSSSSSTSSPESDDYEITSDYTYVPSNERSHYTSKHGSDSLNIHSGLEHTSCQFVPGHSRRSRRQRRESFIGSRKTDKMLKAVAQLQLGLQAQIDALVDHSPQVEQFGPFYWKNVQNATRRNSVRETIVDDSMLSMASTSRTVPLKTKGNARKAKGGKKVSSTNKDVLTSSKSRKDKKKDTWYCGMCKAEHPKGPNTCPHPDRKGKIGKTSSEPPRKGGGKSKGHDLPPASGNDDGEEVSFNQLTFNRFNRQTEEHSDDSS